MSDHTPPTVERHCDVAVVGGSAAGLAAALQLGRQRRSVIVVDAGEARNAPAAHIHGYLGHEGLPPSELTAIGRDEVRSYGVEVVAGRVRTVTRTDDDRFRVELVGGHAIVARRVLAATGLVDERADGTALDTDVVAAEPHFRVRAEPFAALGLLPVAHPSGLGDAVQVDETGATVVPGLYAAGNVTDPSQQVLHAAAHGSRVGAMISSSLAQEDLRAAGRPSAHQADWDHRYGGERMWSGNPNGTLVHEAGGLTPGRALDVGAGEGADALWLAERGWTVTASDISPRALDRVRDEAGRRGLAVACHQADANALDAFEGETFDLVSAQYASIPRTPDDRGVHNLLGAVAPGGTLLVVSHDLEPMRAPVDTTSHSRPFDPDAYVRVDDVVAVVSTAPGWDVELHEKRPRPPGAASTHHVDDIVLRARRQPG